MSSLLDANVLIALTVAEHEHDDRATRWVAGAGELTVCPVVEGALVRFLVGLGAGAAAAARVVDGVRRHPVRGHRRVTDAYLASLAVADGARPATLDRALAQALPGSVVLVPER